MTSPRILRLAVLPLLLGFAAAGCGDRDAEVARTIHSVCADG
jgi:hypothetical protein